MTQYGYEPLSPEDSGSTLLERLNGLLPALLTNHKGSERPSYVQPGMLWIDDSGASWQLKAFDGTADAIIAVIDPVTHKLVTDFVLFSRKLKTGAGLSLNDTAGSDAAPAEHDLAEDLLLKLLFAPKADAEGGIATDKPLNALGVAQAIAAKTIGAAQQMYDLTASRALGTTYTNSTPREIHVTVQVQVTSPTLNIAAYMGGALFEQWYMSVWPNNSYPTVHIRVPPGKTYRIDLAAGTGLKNVWMEMR